MTGLTAEGVPAAAWHGQLAQVVTGFAVKVQVPRTLGNGHGGDREIVLDEPVANADDLRAVLTSRLPEAAEQLRNGMLTLAVNGNVVLSGERAVPIRSGDEVLLLPAIAGG